MNKIYFLPAIGIIIYLFLGCQTQEKTQKEEVQKATEQPLELTTKLQSIIDKNIKNFDEAFEKSGLSETLQEYSDDFRKIIEKDFYEAFLKNHQENIEQVMEKSLKSIQDEIERLEDFMDSNETKLKLEEGLRQFNETLKSFKQQDQ